MALILAAWTTMRAAPHAGIDDRSFGLIPLLFIAIIAGCFLYAWLNRSER